ncbi:MULTISPECIES: amidohydrolase family protein [Streptomyces]|uniref:amidohydrolase family protein n=1 Tax=Streptomyces TaxID=1883 RepID=UPI00361D68E4
MIGLALVTSVRSSPPGRGSSRPGQRPRGTLRIWLGHSDILPTRPTGQDVTRSCSRPFTTWSSYGGFEEHAKGRIAPGYFADFAILDKNPLITPVDEIANIQVLKTVLGGQVVHSA